MRLDWLVQKMSEANGGALLQGVGAIFFGLAIWAIGSLIITAGSHKESILELARHNPWHKIFLGRSLTIQEVNKRIIPGFWTVYRYDGRGAQAIGVFLMVFGAGLSIFVVTSLLLQKFE